MRIPFFNRPRHVLRTPWTWRRVHALAYKHAAYVILIGLAAFCLLVGFMS